MPKTTSPCPKLSDSQLVILSAAAQRRDGALLPLPQGLTAKGAALNKVIQTLCKHKLVEEKKVFNGAPEWRRDEEDRPLGLYLTNAGLLALGLEEAKKQEPAQAAMSVPGKRKTGVSPLRRKATKARPAGREREIASAQSKQDIVIAMLRRRSGVTIEEIIAETGWQPHSVRGFFSGLVKKKLKLPLVSNVGKDGVRHYHIAPLKSAKA